MYHLDKFLISDTATVIEALSKIDKNAEGFLIIKKKDSVLGVLTDGDLRRVILKERDLDTKIKFHINKNFEFIESRDISFNNVSKIFQEKKIKFIPVLDKQKKLLDVLTKDQFQASILSDISLEFDSRKNIDINILNHEIISRPWGFYKTSLLTPFYQSKILCINPGQAISLQSHNHREEHWVNIKGKGKVIVDDKERNFLRGDYIHIPKKSKHRLVNNSKKEKLIVNEVQLGESFDESDIVRYQDNYGRN